MSKRVALLFVHGIGRREPSYHRDSVLNAFQLAYPWAKQDFDGDVGVITFPECEVRVYEAYWASTLPEKEVEGSFKIDQLHEIVWLPSLNRKYLADHRALYPRWLVWLWTSILVPLAALLTFAYYGLSFISKGFGRALFPKTFARLAHKQPAGVKRPEMRDKVDDFFDQVVATVFNYVNAAGGATTPVPTVTDSIYACFEQTLKRAVVEDHCTEVQILAHSLGTLVTYHALTRYRDRTSKLVALKPCSENPNLPRLTHLFTLGSPLEKIHFFWPKIFQDSIRVSDDGPGELAWDNFHSKGDIVSGVLRHYDHLSSVTNHSITGVGGLIAAHTGYRRHPTFLNILGTAVTQLPTQIKKGFKPQLDRTVRAVGETLLIPSIVLVLAAVGLGFMLATGWFTGFMLSGPIMGVEWILVKFFEWNWKGFSVASHWLQTGFAWFMPVVLVFLAIPLGLSRAKDLHSQFWQYEAPPVRNAQDVSRNTHKEPRGVLAILRIRSSDSKRRKIMEQSEKSPYRTKQPYVNLGGLVAILVAIAWIGLHADVTDRAQTWFYVLVLMVAFSVLAGHGVTGYWRGILIDNRNKMSLSRLQLIAWTLLILSALFTVVLTNVVLGWETPLEVEIPSELWVLLGISTASAVGGPAILSTKSGRSADKDEFDKTVTDLEKRSHENVDTKNRDVVIRNTTPESARWGDLLKGDESGNAASVDVGKLQMFFFTFILLIGYGGAISSLLQGGDVITELPTVQEGMNVLLGISHTGYLANKATMHSKEETPKPSQNEEPPKT